MRITSDTTLGQIALLKYKLGVQVVNVTTEGTDGTRRRALVYHPKYGYHAHVADSEAEALDGAFQALVRTIGTVLTGAEA